MRTTDNSWMLLSTVSFVLLLTPQATYLEEIVHRSKLDHCLEVSFDLIPFWALSMTSCCFAFILDMFMYLFFLSFCEELDFLSLVILSSIRDCAEIASVTFEKLKTHSVAEFDVLTLVSALFGVGFDYFANFRLKGTVLGNLLVLAENYRRRLIPLSPLYT